jgi:hypothetical protein
MNPDNQDSGPLLQKNSVVPLISEKKKRGGKKSSKEYRKSDSYHKKPF